MFKKPFAVRGRSVVRGRDRRRLQQRLLAVLCGASSSAGAGSGSGAGAGAGSGMGAEVEAAVAALLPSKRAEAALEELRVTTHGGVYCRVYLAAGEPIAVELEKPAGALSVFPTVAALARLPPAALPPLLTHGALLPILQGGADLMAPGVVYPTGGPRALALVHGEVRALWARGYGLPVAVGVMAFGADAPAARQRAGKAMLILHVHGDRLWQLGAHAALPPVPPSTAGPVPPPYAAAELAPDRDEVADMGALGLADANSNDDDDDDDDGEEKPWQVGAGADQDAEEEDDAEDDEDEDNEDEPKGSSEGAVAAPAVDPSPSEPEPADVDMDTLLDAAFLLALRKTVKDKDLPMLASTFYAQHMQPAQPLGKAIDIKQSTHKKLGKFLAAMEKDGLIKTKETKGVISITAVARTHERYHGVQRLTRFRPSQWQAEAEDGGGPAAGAAAGSAAGAGPAAGAAGPVSKEVQVVELYRTTSTFAEMFEALGRQRTDYFTFADVRAALNEYVARNNMADPANPRMVVLNPFLAEHLVPKNDRANVFTAPRDGLATVLASKLQAYHQITPPNGGEPQLRRGLAKPIEIRVEQRGGHKSVTCVAGLEGFAIDPEKFAKDMQKKLACSGTVVPIAGKQATGVEVHLQGSVASELGEHIVQSAGVPRRFVLVKDKAKG